VAIFIGLYFNEEVSVFQVLSMTVILIGVLIANYSISLKFNFLRNLQKKP
jgi:multidrug transporter EmrE-like cation transporter